MKLSVLIQEINALLDVENIEDSSNNGLQVGQEKDVKKVGFAVDATLETFKKAKKEGCDVLITHHGISWKDNLKHITGNNYERVAYLIKNDLALATYHLPLDVHEKLGNNAQIAEVLGLKKVTPFSYGCHGEVRKPVTLKRLTEFLEKKLDTKCDVYAYGPETVKSISIITGSGTPFVEEAAQISDVLISGDLNYGMQHLAKERGISLLLAGHYETETWGVKALMGVLKKKVSVTFIEA